MDTILTLILIWVVLSLLNYFSKRLKKTEKAGPLATPPSPVKEKSELPPFLKEIFNIPEEKSSSLSAPPIEPKSETEELEYSIERESDEVFRKRKILEKKVHLPTVKETASQPLAVSIPAAAESERQPIFKKFESLKEAVIWKEILDKPLSMRPFRYRRRDQ
jgi:hypothetical protein